MLRLREMRRMSACCFTIKLKKARAQHVVHGSGMGILRKALRQALQQHPHVEKVAEPPQNEGRGGATVVELRV
jgi:dsDNA-specific endonuclease/ATPase MutS2